eukprot:gnl/Dysnectes_brevis/4396_a5886_837.p1 GENE.gnl/Dysnectes_brevis/4396_a5886_837~~gnl/Dysnectes_brevis/4396_a5886_837.p1  ORF type:complete len:171 (+),score=3.57 gnl/Dysnectes_brevis/4396_a5886_837:88-600(+)
MSNQCITMVDVLQLINDNVETSSTREIELFNHLSSSTSGTIYSSVLQSRYNHNYYCNVKGAFITSTQILFIIFEVFGDNSMGRLQKPLKSPIYIQGVKTRPSRSLSFFSIDPLRHANGVLGYQLSKDICCQIEKGSVSVNFSFGASGYGRVVLEHLADDIFSACEEEVSL